MRITAVLLAYGEQPYLLEAVQAALRSTGVDVDAVVVDNGCRSEDIAPVRRLPRVTVLEPGRNTGFTGGCNLGAAAAEGEILAFVNSDAIVDPDALRALAEVAARPSVGIASASLRLATAPETMNSAGNPVHVLGLSWAGGLGRPATAYADEVDIPSATGAAMAVRRDVWAALGGFTDEFFAYCEDADLSLRCWQAGWSVRFVPGAVVRHHYEFSRNPWKFYLLERNRLAMVLCDYERRTLALLLPPLIALEAALLVLGLVRGWGGAKWRGYHWLWRHRGWLRARRRAVQSVRRRADRELAWLWTTRFDAQVVPVPAVMPLLNAVLRGYWAVVRPLL